jgi:hypothetical protein
MAAFLLNILEICRLTHANTHLVYKTNVWAEATHTHDLEFVFGLPFKLFECLTYCDDNTTMSRVIMDFFIYFAKNKLVFRSKNLKTN